VFLFRWHVPQSSALKRNNPFAVAEGTPREAAEGALFSKQIRRGNLEADKLLGAGQFGEVCV
jgi:hypothetical protein